MTAADSLRSLEARAAQFARARLVLVGLALLIVGLGVGWCGHRPAAPVIPSADAHTLDSLAFTAPIFRAHVDTLTRVETLTVRRAAASARAATIAQQSARSLARVADSLQEAAAAQHDTSSSWEAIAASWHAAYDSAQAAADSAQAAYATERLARLTADARADEASRRLTATDALNARLAADLARADPPCRVLWMHCPSRTATGATALALGVAAAIAAHSLK